MKIINYCFSCNTEHDLSKLYFIGQIKDIKCDCGGYVISPSGKAKFKLEEDSLNDIHNSN